MAMRISPVGLLLLIGLPLLTLVGLACSTARPTATPVTSVQGGKQETQTASYRIELLVGPVQSIMGSDMSMTDQGRPVNHHLEVHIYHKGSGAAVQGANPTV